MWVDQILVEVEPEEAVDSTPWNLLTTCVDVGLIPEPTVAASTAAAAAEDAHDVADAVGVVDDEFVVFDCYVQPVVPYFVEWIRSDWEVQIDLVGYVGEERIGQ